MADKNIYTVVVADDEDELREAVCTMIPWEALGFHLVGNASNGLDALELVERLEPDLLLTTDLQMQEIARRCGYTDQHYFSYCFKKYSGTSPVALRRARAAGEARP